jgi:hypothetical protein
MQDVLDPVTEALYSHGPQSARTAAAAAAAIIAVHRLPRLSWHCAAKDAALHAQLLQQVITLLQHLQLLQGQPNTAGRRNNTDLSAVFQTKSLQ